jgi:hypothetical protein
VLMVLMELMVQLVRKAHKDLPVQMDLTVL